MSARSERLAPTRDDAIRIANSLERLCRKTRPLFESYGKSLSRAELDEEGWELQVLIDHLDTLENQAGNVASLLSKYSNDS